MSEQYRQIIEAQIAAYEQKRDQALAEANLAQGAAMALRELLSAAQNGEQDGSKRAS